MGVVVFGLWSLVINEPEVTIPTTNDNRPTTNDYLSTFSPFTASYV